MHELASHHCSYCQHFEHSFQTDLVVEWGYCNLKRIPPKEALKRIQEATEAGDYRELFSRAEELGLFMPTITQCERFSDLYPF